MLECALERDYCISTVVQLQQFILPLFNFDLLWKQIIERFHLSMLENIQMNHFKIAARAILKSDYGS